MSTNAACPTCGKGVDANQSDEPTAEDVVKAIQHANAMSAKHAPEGGELIARVMRSVNADKAMASTLHAAFSADELFRLTSALIEMQQDPLGNADAETLENFLTFADPDGH